MSNYPHHGVGGQVVCQVYNCVVLSVLGQYFFCVKVCITQLKFGPTYVFETINCQRT